MSNHDPVLWLVLLAVLLGVPMELRRRRALKRFWDRHCMGIRWRRRFPGTPKAEIREFLTLFVDAFCYKIERRTCFSPDDRVMDVYRAEYPSAGWPDNMELETFATSLEERYGIDFTALWREDITLGELFNHSKARGV